MHAFETLLALLLGATVLSLLAKRMGIPYPTLLAVGGAVVALIPGSPELELPPDLILALFVAPVLLDAAFDAPLRDLRQNWVAVTSLVVAAVVVTTAAVAVTVRLIFPDLPWGVAIALGAIVAPPDAVAALAVLRQVDPPHRLRVILEGESLFNDASALLIYRLAVGAVGAGSFEPVDALPDFALVAVGSGLAGWALSYPVSALMHRIDDAPSAVIFEFGATFAMWILAERLGLSPVVTVVAFGLAASLRDGAQGAHIRVPSFAIWEAAITVLNVLAFALIGLQLGPILERLTGPELRADLVAAVAVLGVVVLVRFLWVLTHHGVVRLVRRGRGDDGGPTPDIRDPLVVGWSGMRGIVTLASALALPADFPFRDFILLTAFVVVVGTLVLQGLTLGPLLRRLRFPDDDVVGNEVAHARKVALKAAVREIDGNAHPAAERLRQEYGAALGQARRGGDARDTADNRLRRQTVQAAREALSALRHDDVIGDDAYRQVEAELDLLELSAAPSEEEA